MAGAVVLWWFGAIRLMLRTASLLVAITSALPIVTLVASCLDHYPFYLFAGTMLTGALFGLSLKAGEQRVRTIRFEAIIDRINGPL